MKAIADQRVMRCGRADAVPGGGARMGVPRMKICTMPIGWPPCRQMKVAGGWVYTAASLSGARGSGAACDSTRAAPG